MSLKGIMFKVAKEMDKQRFQSIKQQEKEREVKTFINSASNQKHRVPARKNNELFIEENIIEITGIYDKWVESYLEMERIRDSIDIENEFEDYIENIQYTITLTEVAIERIDGVPKVFNAAPHILQYLDKMKESFLWVLKSHIRRNEVIINGFIETIENGVATVNTPELANDFLLKGERYFKSGNMYLEKVMESISV